MAYSVGITRGRTKRFRTLDAALAFVREVFNRTGVVLSIVEAK